MIKFCPNCGGAIAAPVGFCPQCGHRISDSPAGAGPTAQTVPPSQQAIPLTTQHKGMSTLGKILLIALTLIVVIAIGIGTAAFYLFRGVKHRVQQISAEYSEDRPAVSGRAALGGRSACDLLPKSEFRRITGLTLTEAVPSESQYQLTCEYFTSSPTTVKARKTVRAEEIKDPQEAIEAVQDAMKEARGRAPVLRVTIHLADTKATMLGTRIAAGITSKDSRVEDLGDEAYMDGTGTILAARKGKRSVVLTMPLLPSSKETGPLLAKVILDQI
jgi:hypothetical protein